MIANHDHNGRTAAGKYTWRPAIQMEPDDFPPESKYWEGRARTATSRLLDMLSTEAFDKWLDDNVSDNDTWRAIAEKEEAYIHSLSLQQMEEKA